MQNEIASGFFVRLTDEEQNDLNEYLAAGGFEPPPEGLRQLVLSVLYEEEQPEEAREKTFFEKAAENPELLNQGLNALGKLFKRKGAHR